MIKSAEIKIATLNMEGRLHTPRVIQFLGDENPDVACLQEVPSSLVSRLRETQNYHGRYASLVYVPSGILRHDMEGGNNGLLILSRERLESASDSSSRFYYRGTESHLPVANGITSVDNRLLLTGKVEWEGSDYTVATTHFTWTPDGEPNKEQWEDLPKLKAIFSRRVRECIFAADTNSPRGGKIWAEMAKIFTDNVPKDITSTLDPNLHRKGDLQLVIDGLFTTPEYRAFKVRAVEGVSDHKALVGLIERV